MSKEKPEDGVLKLIQQHKPVFRNAHDAVAFALHAYILNTGNQQIKCVAVSDESKALAENKGQEAFGMSRIPTTISTAETNTHTCYLI